jgi:hypothetical protein
MQLSAIADRALVTLTPGAFVATFDNLPPDRSDVPIRAKRFYKLGDGSVGFLATIFV